MDLQALKAEILAKCSPELLAQQNTQLIADKISEGRTKIVSTPLGTGTIMAVLGDQGGIFMDTLVTIGATNRNVYWAVQLLQDGRLDIGILAARAQITALGHAVPNLATGLAEILKLAEHPDPVDVHCVNCVCWSDTGEWSI